MFNRKKEGTRSTPANIEQVGIPEKRPETGLEFLGFRVLSFLKRHLDMFELANFDPEQELQEIRKIVAKTKQENVGTQRLVLLKNFRTRLRKFRENMAKVQIELEDLLIQDPDLDKNDLRQKVRSIVEREDMQAYRRYFDQAVTEYLRRHETIRGIVENYTAQYDDGWQLKLFEDLFDFTPTGQTKIEVMPASIYVRMQDPADFVGAFLSGSNPKTKTQEEKIARSTGGARLKRSFPKLPALTGAVLIENSGLITTDNATAIKVHEEEHEIHDFYPRSSFVAREGPWVETLRGEINLDQFQRNLRQLARSTVTLLHEDAKSEILANLKDGRWTTEEIKNSMLDDNGFYNYLVNWGNDEHFVKSVVGHMIKSGVVVKKSDGTNLDDTEEIETMARTTITDVWNTEYKSTIRKAMDATGYLLSLYKDKPRSRETVLRLLSQEPLNKWPRLARILS